MSKQTPRIRSSVRVLVTVAGLALAIPATASAESRSKCRASGAELSVNARSSCAEGRKVMKAVSAQDGPTYRAAGRRWTVAVQYETVLAQSPDGHRVVITWELS
jgi:hypothetical protein